MNLEKTPFYILTGNNGATYIINTSTWSSISSSLDFYQARSAKSKLMKGGLLLYLILAKNFIQKKIKSATQCEQVLQVVTDSKVNFELDNNCSILISPTRDKVIVHHHNAYFQKFAFGESYSKVKNEVLIYDLLQQKPISFQVSHFSDYNDLENDFLSFKISNESVVEQSTESYSLDYALAEFFSVTLTEETSLSKYLENQLELLKKLNNSELKYIENHLTELLKNNKHTKLPRGLVHNDFKPWNIKEYDKILIFDFEEAVVNGLPMMDLFNFYCDPIIRYESPEIVFKELINTNKTKIYNAYKTQLNIIISTELMLDVYLIERVVFWKKAEEFTASAAYLNLFNFIHHNA